MKRITTLLLLALCVGCTSFRAETADASVQALELLGRKADEIADSYEAQNESLLRVTTADSPTATNLRRTQAEIAEWRTEVAAIIDKLVRTMIAQKGLTADEKQELLSTLLSIRAALEEK